MRYHKTMLLIFKLVLVSKVFSTEYADSISSDGTVPSNTIQYSKDDKVKQENIKIKKELDERISMEMEQCKGNNNISHSNHVINQKQEEYLWLKNKLNSEYINLSEDLREKLIAEEKKKFFGIMNYKGLNKDEQKVLFDRIKKEIIKGEK